MMMHAKIRNPASKSMALCIDVTFCRFMRTPHTRTHPFSSLYIIQCIQSLGSDRQSAQSNVMRYEQEGASSSSSPSSSAQRWHCAMSRRHPSVYTASVRKWYIWQPSWAGKNIVWFMVLWFVARRHVVPGREWVMERERKYAFLSPSLCVEWMPSVRFAYLNDKSITK